LPFAQALDKSNPGSGVAGFVAFSAELDISSQGESIEESHANLVEALRGLTAISE
jgi:hypothetical protein